MPFNFKKLFFLLLLTGLSISTGIAQEKKWELKSNKEGVKLYLHNTGGIYEVKLVTSIKTSLSGLLKLFNEVDRYSQWGYKIGEARLIRRISPTEMIYYVRLDFPWPVSDRDLVIHSTLEQNPKTKVVTTKSVAEPWHVPRKKDVIRMTDAYTSWKLFPNDSGWLYIEYYIYSDPGGYIPDWLVNMAVDVGPVETIKSMRKILKEPQYQNAKLAHIKD